MDIILKNMDKHPLEAKRDNTKSRCPFVFLWCRSRDLNPDGRGPLPPQDSVSTKFHHFGIL